MRPDQKVIRARSQLLMYMPFYGTLALSLKVKESKSINTVGTDGRYFYYNENYISKLTEKEVNFVVAHTVMHPALGHIWRKGTREPIVWDHACDYIINQMILDSDPKHEVFKMPEGSLFNEKFKGMYAEEVYEKLASDQGYSQKAKSQAEQGNPQTTDDHSVWQNSPDNEDGEEDDGFNNEEDWRGRLIQAAQAAKMRGKLPAMMERIISDLVEPQKNWRQLLAEFIQQDIGDYGWNPPDRRFLHADLVLPDYSEEVDVVREIVFAIDTSGSIGYNEMRTFISECVGCMAQFGGRVVGHLIYCDADIAAVYPLEDVEHGVPKGGGGTDFRPVFEWVEENLDECAGVVYLTDLMGPFPDSPPSYPTLWVSTVPKLSAPFGNTTYIDIVR